jgi:hypothetical protein
MPVVQNIGLVPVNSSDKPLTDVIIDSVRITKFPASVANVAKGPPVSVYPNPCNGQLNIDLPEIITKLEIVNMLGQVVYSTIVKGSLKIDIHNQPKGLYILHFVNSNGIFKRKLIVQ